MRDRETVPPAPATPPSDLLAQATTLRDEIAGLIAALTPQVDKLKEVGAMVAQQVWISRNQPEAAALPVRADSPQMEETNADTRQSPTSLSERQDPRGVRIETAPCVDCGHPREKHPNDIDCAADDGFDNCGCPRFIPDRDVPTPLSVLYAVRSGLNEILGCRKVKAHGCDCKVGGQMALAAIEAMIRSAAEVRADAPAPQDTGKASS